MEPQIRDGIERWLIEQGLAGASEMQLLEGLCVRLLDAGFPLARGLGIIDTLHPVWEGRAFIWRADGSQERSMVEYGSHESGEAAASWEASAFYHLIATGGADMRRCFAKGDPADFRNLASLRDEGQTDVFIMVHRFDDQGGVGRMDGLYSQWTTERPEGFDPAHLDVLRRLTPPLALALKCASLVRIAGTLAEVYLGRDAGRRVLRGQVTRGVAEQIGAVLWFSDLRHYTHLSDTAEPEHIIPLLNDYAEAVISSIENAGGEVLKLIGDGVLAIFRASSRREACRSALRSEADLRQKLVTLKARREADGLPVTDVYLGIHVGKVFYGNIGSDTRLDFTVVGPAVNEVSRIASLCRSVEQDVIVSPDVVGALPEEERARFVSLGRFALRGVARPQELFTLDRSNE